MTEQTIDPREVKLGKKPGVVHDPRTFKLESFLEPALPKAPAESYVGKGEPIRMYANDDWGDCTCAAIAHGIDVHERATRQVEVQLNDDDVLTAYKRVMVGDDGGAYLLDVLNDQRKLGMGREADGSPHKVTAYASVRLRDRDLWKVASWMFGGLYIGALLPRAAADQLRAGKTRWTVVTDDSGRPGSWGGHAMYAVGYSSGSVVLSTWDLRIRAEWDWIERYVDEAYAIVSEDFLSRSGRTPQGFSSEKLEDALAAID